MVSFDTKPKLLKNAVQRGVIRKRNHMNMHCFIGNSKDRGIRKTESFNLSFKMSWGKGYKKGQIWSNRNTHVIVLIKKEWPGGNVFKKIRKEWRERFKVSRCMWRCARAIAHLILIGLELIR